MYTHIKVFSVFLSIACFEAKSLLYSAEDFSDPAAQPKPPAQRFGNVGHLGVQLICLALQRGHPFFGGFEFLTALRPAFEPESTKDGTSRNNVAIDIEWTTTTTKIRERVYFILVICSWPSNLYNWRELFSLLFRKKNISATTREMEREGWVGVVLWDLYHMTKHNQNGAALFNKTVTVIENQRNSSSRFLKARLDMRFLMRFLMRFRIQNAPYPTLHECLFREA